MDDIRGMSDKGTSLTWNDFAPYKGVDIGSGLWAIRYEVNEKYHVIVGGTLDADPMYISLINKTNHEYIDIRTGDLEAFLSKQEN